jgi:superfamily II DNA or RNA helicase
MVSEGVDVPRLRVGVYATAARTELFFRQVVGRFIRRTPAPARQMSYLLMPADHRLKQLAVEIEEERRHALELMGLGAEEPVELEPVRRGDGPGFEALSSSAAQLDEAILTQTTMQLFATEDPPPPTRARATAAPGPAPEAAFAARERLRAERARLVALVSRRTREQHRAIHARVNRATGARSVGAATREELERGNELLRRELQR